MAARFAGCRLADLLAEIRRDADFKQQVQQQELRPEIQVLRSMLDAGRDPKQWRAAAWVLERFYPRRYAARKGDALSSAALRAALEAEEQRRRTRHSCARSPRRRHSRQPEPLPPPTQETAPEGG
jgi:hypothetical protein